MLGRLDSGTLTRDDLRDRERKGLVPRHEPVLGGVMAFFVGVVLFVGLCGYLDAGLPWPSRRRRFR
jgi:hypothetical protein